MKQILLRKKQIGDTLIEVLLSTVVLSAVLASAFTLSSRALRINQGAQERTEVVNKMREQLERIRGASQNRTSTAWQSISFLGTSQAFYLHDNGAGQSVVVPWSSGSPTDDADPNDLFEIHVEATNSGDSYDFKVVAEWDRIGASDVRQEAGMVLRILR